MSENPASDLQVLRELEQLGAISKTAITLPEGTEYPKVEALFSYFGKVSHALRWYIGDLINWGEGRYGDKIYDAAEATGLTPGTLQNYASVAGRIAPERRRENLSHAVHQTVAYLEPAEQVRWLERAEERGWTIKQLRELMRDEGAIKPRSEPQWSQPPLESPQAASAPDGDAEPGAESGAAALPAPALSLAPAPAPPSYPIVLAELRDGAETMVERSKADNVSYDRWELERDALNWALEQLAPELA